MSEVHRLLELIEEAIAGHGGDLGGWTRLNDDSLQIFDGRVTLRTELFDPGPAGKSGMLHTHIYATLHDYDDEILDACVCSVGGSVEAALRQAAALWLTGVAGPIRSLLDDQPVCNTCRANVVGGEDSTSGDSIHDFGLKGVRAFVGPATARLFPGDKTPDPGLTLRPWFEHAAAAAAPRRIHLAKTVLMAQGANGWRRTLEVDGHESCCVDSNWAPDFRAPPSGFMTRFAVFEFPPESEEVARRAEVEHTICTFFERFVETNDVTAMMEEMIRDGFDADLVHEVESFSTIAIGRMLFESQGAVYSPTCIYVRRDGRIERDVPLISFPTYTRARALMGRIAETLPRDSFESLCLYSGESQAIVNAMSADPESFDLSQLQFSPPIVPERGATAEMMQAAIASLPKLPAKKPWWKFW